MTRPNVCPRKALCNFQAKRATCVNPVSTRSRSSLRSLSIIIIIVIVVFKPNQTSSEAAMMCQSSLNQISVLTQIDHRAIPSSSSHVRQIKPKPSVGDWCDFCQLGSKWIYHTRSIVLCDPKFPNRLLVTVEKLSTQTQQCLQILSFK